MDSEVLELAKNGDNNAMEEIISRNTGLVWSIVRKFLNRGFEADDLYQTGCIGLIKAVRNFDSTFDVCFSTYAVPMIMGEIRRYMRDDGMIKVSRNLRQLSAKAYAVREMTEKTTGKEPTVKEIANKLGVETEELVMAMDATVPIKSINSRIDDDEHELGDIIENGDCEEDFVIDRMDISSAIRLLQPRERKIIVLRYFMGKTQSQVAERLGISQVQVSRIEKKILSEMKKKITV